MMILEVIEVSVTVKARGVTHCCERTALSSDGVAEALRSLIEPMRYSAELAIRTEESEASHVEVITSATPTLNGASE